MSNGGKFAGKTVLVTGGAAGLGRAHALGFCGEGAHIILADIVSEGLEETKALIEDAGGTAETHLCDMGRESEIEALGAAVSADHSRLDVLINNAGLHTGEIARGFFGLGMEKWQHFYAVNVIGPLLMAETLRHQLKEARGLIINTSSMASYQPQSAYGITKASLNIFTHAMAAQFAVDQVRCVAIAPGLMETPAAMNGVDEENWARLKAMQQVQRQGLPDDIVQLAMFLASDAGSFINNDVIMCDGGNQMRGFRI